MCDLEDYTSVFRRKQKDVRSNPRPFGKTFGAFRCFFPAYYRIKRIRVSAVNILQKSPFSAIPIGVSARKPAAIGPTTARLNAR